MKRFNILAFLLLALSPWISYAASLTDAAENLIVDDIFRTTAWTKPTNFYVSLHTGACSDSATGTEVSGGNYARVAIPKGDANWTGTHGSATGASSGTSGTISNAAAVPFAAPTANWGLVTHFAIWNAITAGTQLICNALTASKTINNGDAAPSFAINALTVQIDN